MKSLCYYCCDYTGVQYILVLVLYAIPTYGCAIVVCVVPVPVPPVRYRIVIHFLDWVNSTRFRQHTQIKLIWWWPCLVWRFEGQASGGAQWGAVSSPSVVDFDIHASFHWEGHFACNIAGVCALWCFGCPQHIFLPLAVSIFTTRNRVSHWNLAVWREANNWVPDSAACRTKPVSANHHSIGSVAEQVLIGIRRRLQSRKRSVQLIFEKFCLGDSSSRRTSVFVYL